MEFTGHSSTTKQQHGYFRYIRTALPAVFGNDFHTYGHSKHLVNTKTLSHIERSIDWPVKEETAKRPSFLRLDSRGESSKNEWVNHGFSQARNSSSRNVPTLASFSGSLRHHADVREKQPCIGYPKSVKPYVNTLNITSAVKQLCEKKDLLLPHQQNKASISVSNIAMTNVHPFHYWPRTVTHFVSKDDFMQQAQPKPVELISNLQLQCEDNSTNRREQLQYDFHITVLNVGNLLPVFLPCLVDLTDCMPTFSRDLCQNLANQLAVVTCRSSDAINNACTLDSRCLRRQTKQPRYNCRRKRLHVYHNTRYRKLSAQCGTTFSSGSDRSQSDIDSIHYDVVSKTQSNSIGESEWTSCAGKHAISQHLLSSSGPFNDREENNAVWENHSYPHPSFPSSLYDAQETHIEELCSFASSFFISGSELDSSDLCSTDSDDLDCSGYPSPLSTFGTDILADALLSGLPCIRDPFIDDWIMDFSDGTRFDSDFEVYFEDDDTAVPSEDVICRYSMGVHEANVRWNETYSFPADVFSETCQHHSRMVQFSSDVSMVTVLNQLEWADAYHEARCGPWEQYARDRERFARRVREVESQISWILSAEHRATKYHYLQTCMVPDESVVWLLPS